MGTGNSTHIHFRDHDSSPLEASPEAYNEQEHQLWLVISRKGPRLLLSQVSVQTKPHDAQLMTDCDISLKLLCPSSVLPVRKVEKTNEKCDL